jgi:acetyltransferase-like isoleucine patch superfamily enzyme
VARSKRQQLYLTPFDHAFASGPVFTRPASAKAARAHFDREEDADLLWRLFESFHTHARIGDRLRLGMRARIVSKNPKPTVTIGSDCAIRGTLRCEPGASLRIGNTVYIGDDAILSAQKDISIGDLTLIAHGVHVFDNDSHPTDADEREAHFKAILGLPHAAQYEIAGEPVRIGSGCWLGFNSVVMKGVTIGDGSIVAANSVVIEDVPAQSVVAGNPARVVKAIQAGHRAAG